MNNAFLGFAGAAGFLIAFALWWMGILYLIARLGGWQALAQVYAVDPNRFGTLGEGTRKRFPCSSMMLGSSAMPGNYSNCVTISVSDLGIGFCIFPLMRFKHPPLFIPWQFIERCEVKKHLFFFTQTALYAKGVPHPLRVGGKAGQEIIRCWRELHPTASNNLLQ